MEDYDSSHETSKAIIDMASALMGRLEHPQARDLKFFRWHNAAVTGAILKYKDRYTKAKKYKEKVLQEFHKKRSSTIFEMKWAQYLDSSRTHFFTASSCLTLHLRKSLIDVIRASAPEDEGTSEVEVASLTYEEENAIR